MAIDIRPEVIIRCARRDVAAYMFDPANDLAWTGGIIASTAAQAGPLVTGATVQRTAKFLGRTFGYGYVVTAHEPDRMIELAVDKPFPMLIRYELADVEGSATVAAIRATGKPGGFFGLATPLMRSRVRANITADLQRLRNNLESRSGNGS